MKKTTFKILFYPKRTKLLKNGEAPIFVRITIRGEKAEARVKRSIAPPNWNSARGEAKTSTAALKELNQYLNAVQSQFYSYERELMERNIEVNPKRLIDMFLGIEEEKFTLVKLFEKHIQELEKLVNIDYSATTLQRYKTSLKHIRNFLLLHSNLVDIELKDINLMFIKDFEVYLKTVIKCEHNSAMKHVKSLKKIIRSALANDFIRKDPFAAYAIKTKPVDRGFLSHDELERIFEHEFTIERLSVVRDLFIFQCYTGLAYTDLEKLSNEHIHITQTGEKWLVIRRTKSGVQTRLPILPRAEDILKKYETDPLLKLKGKLLPVPSNQKMNGYLKEIATLCGIDKDLHTHLARHTFATTVTLLNGIPIETISKMLGHTKIQTTQIYSKVADFKIEKDMRKLMER